jgi:NADPH-dependent 2,4-dienoyl-CoA reductase/sulfur reductase-like enzyme
MAEPLGAKDRLVVVGASLAGSRAAEAARRAGFEGSITLVGAEPHPPYDRPPLSKELLATGPDATDVFFQGPEHWSGLGVDMMLASPATALDVDARTVAVGDDLIPYDGLVIATGADARRLPGQPVLPGVHVLRTIDDSHAIESELANQPDVVVIGAGFIGSEVAASARTRNCRVTVLEAMHAPLVRGLGAEMGMACGQLHLDHGSDLRLSVAVDAIVGEGQVEGVRLADGTVVPAGLVVVGVGVTPATGWLAGSGLEVVDGVVCDATLAAGPPGVYVAGDCARWPNTWIGPEPVRLEHWTNATEQGMAAGRNVVVGTAEATPYSTVPFVWSDQYGSRIQVAGHPGPEDRVEVLVGGVEDRSFVAGYERGGRLVGVMALNQIRAFVKMRRMLPDHPSWEDAVAQAETLR